MNVSLSVGIRGIPSINRGSVHSGYLIMKLMLQNKMCSWIFNYRFLSHTKLWQFLCVFFTPSYWKRKAVTPLLRPLAHLYFIEQQSVWELGRNQKQGGPCIPSGSLSLPWCSNFLHRASLRVDTSLHSCFRWGLLQTQCSPSPACMILLCLLWLSWVQDK